MTRPEALFIDWDGTASVGKFWGHLEGQDIYSQVQQFLFVDNKPLVNDWMVGGVNSEEVVLRIAQETGLNSAFLYKELVKSCKQMELVSDDVLKLVDKTRNKGLVIAIATDNMDTFTRWTVPALHLDQHFDGILNSYELGFFKHTKGKFFGMFLEKHNLSPQVSIMIDDSENNKNPLLEYGFDYRKIERGVGLVLELKKILKSI
jgi:phosphoglycolate phosphatase-like HAD superfamily hydrolase